MQFPIESILIAIVVFQLLLLSQYLCFRGSGNRLGRVALGALFLTLALNLLAVMIRTGEGWRLPAGLDFLVDGFVLLWGPCIYLYLESQLDRRRRFQVLDLAHAIPFVGFGLLGLALTVYAPAGQNAEMLDRIDDASAPIVVKAVGALLYLHFLVYYGLSWRVFVRHRRLMEGRPRRAVTKRLVAIRSVLVHFGILLALALIHGLIPFASISGLQIVTLLGLVGYLFFFANRVLQGAIHQSDLSSGILIRSASEGLERPSLIREEEWEPLRERLARVMEEQRPYLNPDLSVDQLAAELEMHPKKLSHLINQTQQMGFFEYVNGYRIEEAKARLVDSRHASILEILYDVGFNSKSTFNTCFKARVGMTPKEYRKQSRQA